MAIPVHKVRSAALWVGLLVVLAFGLRVAFSMQDSWDEESGRYLYSGNDPYYHDRTVRHIMETGEHLSFDPAINFPNGAYNPNPPLFDWTTVPVAKVFEMAGAQDPVGLALNVMVALWGALTVIPVYHLGRDLWNRQAGLWAAFFMALSAPHISRSVFGFADHDATTMFWISLAFAFLVKALRSLDGREHVSAWRDPATRNAGLRSAMRDNRTALSWSFLSGVALCATALTWKGFPYALAVMAIAVGLQLLQDHLRNRDSTAMFTVYALPLAMVVSIPYALYYRAFPTFLDTTIVPSLIVLAAVLVVGLILVPTRNLPSIVVFPALLVAAAGAMVLLLVVFPAMGETVFTGLGYFRQTKLYTTIAEAQRTELGRMAAEFGFFAFLIAFWGLGRAIGGAWKGRPHHMLATAWGLVAIFMAFAAARFVTNAAPVMAIFMGSAAAVIGSKLGFENVRKRFRRQHGRNVVGSGATSLTWRYVLGVLMVGLLLVLPFTWVGVDAATPSEFEHRHDMSPKRWGAFGIDYGVENGGWLALFDHLNDLDVCKDPDTFGCRPGDADYLPMAQRPAFMAWWDYGHWATAVGHHPTVADPFQSHFAMAGRFLASETEERAMGWLLLLLLNDDAGRNGGTYSPGVSAALASHHPGLPAELAAAPDSQARFEILNRTDIFVSPDQAAGAPVFSVYEAVQEATGKQIRYFGTDLRMWPLGGSGIFYAPVYLANKNPDDFVRTVYLTESGSQLVEHRYAVDEDGDSYQLPRSQVWYEGEDGTRYKVVGGRAFVEGTEPHAGSFDIEGGIALSNTGAQVLPTERFRSSMYAKAFGNIRTDLRAPGDGLSHWRTVFEDVTDLPDRDPQTHEAIGYDRRNTALAEYYAGVVVKGRVTDDAGAPLEGHEVTFADGFGARHHRTRTDADGRYTVVAPFAVDGDLVLEVRSAGSIVANRTDGVQFTRAQARSGAEVPGIDITVARGSVEGIAFKDDDGNGVFNATAESPLAGVLVELGGRNMTTGPDGKYRFDGVQAGVATAVGKLDGYRQANRAATVPPGGVGTADLAMSPAPVKVDFTVTDGGSEVRNAPYKLVGPRSLEGRTSPNGTASHQLQPGTWEFTINATVLVDGSPRAYDHRQVFEVPFAGQAMAVAVELGRNDVGPPAP